jgi:hypothetical protein
MGSSEIVSNQRGGPLVSEADCRVLHFSKPSEKLWLSPAVKNKLTPSYQGDVLDSSGIAAWTTKSIRNRCFNTNPKRGEVMIAVLLRKHECLRDVTELILMCVIKVLFWNCWVESITKS